jgi:hypothetical protein
MRLWGWCVFLAIGAGRVEAASDTGPVVEEVWEVAHVEGTKVGFLHTTVHRNRTDGPERLRTTAELDLTFKRHNALLRVRMEQGSEETPEGKVLRVFMRQYHERGQQLVLTGTVEGDRLHIVVDRGRLERRIGWSEEVAGLYKQWHLFKARKVKPGDNFRFRRFEPTYTAIANVHVTVKEPEEVTVLGERKRLLRVEMMPDKIEARNATVQIPGCVWWLDQDFIPVRRQMELDGLGTVLLSRTTQQRATSAAAGQLPDIGLKTLIPLNRPILNPHGMRSAVYRITLRDADPASALARDGHQEVRNLNGNTFELHVHPVRPAPGPAQGEPPAEFLASCHYINCDDPLVKELARKAGGSETEPWKKAQRMERWVKQNMRVDNGAPLVPAGQVARELRGDCRLYALLTAALCRAEGIPARTAIGLIYVEKNRRPFIGFHMWTEVWIAGRWLGLDGTLGRGAVGAAHIKIADHSWHDVQSLTPLLPVSRVLGKIAIEVVNTD